MSKWSVKMVSMDVTEIGVLAAKTKFSKLLEHVSRGRTYRITKRGKVVAELRPATIEPMRPKFGEYRDRIKMAKNFDAPLDDFKDYM